MTKETSPREAEDTTVLAGQGPGDELVPAGFRLWPDPRTRTLADGTVITGGYPTRVLRLSAAGARHVAGWWAGTPVPGNTKARALARRLLDTGITQIRKLHGGRRIENIDEVVHIGDKIQVEIREVDDRGKLSLVPVEVVEREAAGEDLSGGDSRGDRPREPGTAATAVTGATAMAGTGTAGPGTAPVAGTTSRWLPNRVTESAARFSPAACG